MKAKHPMAYYFTIRFCDAQKFCISVFIRHWKVSDPENSAIPFLKYWKATRHCVSWAVYNQWYGNVYMCFVASIKTHIPLKRHYIWDSCCEIISWFYLLITRRLHDCVHVGFLCFLSLSIFFRDLCLSHHYCTLLIGSQCARRLLIVLFNIFLNFLFLRVSVNTLPETESIIIWCVLQNTKTLQKRSHLNASYPSFNWLYFFDTVILKFLPPSLMCCLLQSASSFAASVAFTISINALSTCNENMINVILHISHRQILHITYHEHLKVEL